MTLAHRADPTGAALRPPVPDEAGAALQPFVPGEAGAALAGTASAGTTSAGTALAGTALAGTALAGTALAGAALRPFVDDESGAALRPFVPDLVATWDRTHGDRPWAVVNGALVSADISGFTALSERLAGLGREGAEELTTVINACFDGMIEAAARQGGDVLKFGGDALLILFTGPEHTERACAAAVAMRSWIARPMESPTAGRVRLRMSQGVHAGDFAFYLVDGGHRELIVAGPGATATVTCEAAANAGEILVSEAAAALLPPDWLGEGRPQGRILRRRNFPDPGWVDLGRDERPDDLTAFVPRAQRLQVAAGADGEHRPATIAFVELSGTDALAPPDLAERLAVLAATVEGACRRHDVHWLASDVYADGGKVILGAGAPTSTGEDEERMLRTVRAVLDADVPLTLRAGVNRGPVFAGEVGGARRRTFTVMGDAVNLAARLMQKAVAGQLVASRAVLERARSPFSAEPLEPFTVKGKAKPIDASLVGAVTTASALPRTTATPWVGRQPELDVLEAALEAARAGSGGTVEVIAEPGMGKTRLVDELMARHPETATITVACGQYAMSTPYFALRSLLRRVAAIDQDASPAECGEHLAGWVAAAAPGLEPWLPLIAIPFDAVVPPTAEADRIDPAFRRQRMHAVVLDLLAATLPDGGLIRVEDAHWLDDASRDLLAELVIQIGSHPWLAVVTRRPGPAVLTDVASTTRLELAPLAADHAARLAALLVGDEGTLSDRDLDLLVERGGGNPLFTAELAGAAAAQGSAEELPDSVEAVLMSRIDTLEPVARRRLREASVLGMLVDPPLVAAATGDADLGDPDAWQPLEAFLEPLADGTFRFRHALFRQAAYEGLSYRRRRQLHGDVGDALEAAAGDQLDDVAGLLAIHFHRARRPAKAWTFSVRAGELARAKYANVEAADMLTQALDVAAAAQVDHGEIARVAEALGDVSELAARYDRAWVAYNVARRWASDLAGRGRLAWKQGIVREREGQYVAALQWFRRALDLFEAGASDDERIAAAEVRLAYAGVRYRQARYAEAVRWARRAAEEAEDLGNRPVLAHACYLLELAFLSWPQPEAARYQGRALPMLEEIGDLVSQAKVLNNLGIAAYRRGDWATAVDTYGRAVAAAEAGGAVVFEAMAVFNLAEVRADQGHLEEAEALLHRARRAWRSARYSVGIGVATLHLGRIAARAGRTEEALDLLEAARARFEGLHAADFVLEARVRMVECLQLAGRHREAGDAADAAAGDAHSVKCDPILWSALQRHRALARLVDGDEDDARPLLEDSLRRADDAGAPYERAQTLLVRAGLGDEPARAEAEDILARLAVVAGPWIPATRSDRMEEAAPCGT